MPGFKHGRLAVVKIDNSAGALQTLTAYIDKFTMPREAETALTTTFGKTSKTRIAGLKDGKATAEGPWDSVIEAHFQPLLGYEFASIDYFPEGETTGNRRLQAESICTSYEVETGVDGAVRWKAEFELTGDVTAGTAP